MAEAKTATIEVEGNGLGKGVCLDNTGSAFSPYHRLATQLDDAERLLVYAAETGREMDPKIGDAVLNARNVSADKWDKPIAVGVLSALTSLSQKLHPVTAASLKICAGDKIVEESMRGYKRFALFLTPIIILFSLATFITSGISKAIETAITRGNTLAVTLGDQLRAVESNKESQIVPRDLQEFVSIIRALDTYAWQLNLYIAYIDVDGYLTVSDLWSRKPKLIPEFQIEPGDAAKPDLAKQKIKVYQGVRDFADRVKETVTLIYGAMGSCILPVLYALLGACAYILRSIEEHYKIRTLNPTDTHTVRFVTAVIGGAVVGLFPNFSVNQTPTISPLAIAFLVGYAIDVFFSFLDSLLQPFTRRGNPPPETKATR